LQQAHSTSGKDPAQLTRKRDKGAFKGQKKFISPVICAFPSKVNLSRNSIFDNSKGTDPDRLLFDKNNPFKFDNFPRTVGIAPDIDPPTKFRWINLDKYWTSSGIELTRKFQSEY